MKWFTDGDVLACCEACPLGGSTKVHSFQTNDDVVDILVVGQSPGKNEVAAKRPFVGESGDLINPVLTQYSPNIAYINVLGCRPVDKEKSIDRVPVSAEIKSCRDRFEQDFLHFARTYNPKVILVLGAVAKKAIANIMKAATSENGLFIDGLNLSCLNMHQMEHPAHILRNPHMRSQYITNMHNVLKSVFDKNDIDAIINSFVVYDDDMRDDFLEDYNNSINIGADIETNGLNMFDFTFTIGTGA
jgi:DNA polymerase